MTAGVDTDDLVVITCAITGGGSRDAGNEFLPYTPEELAAEAKRAADAGATVIHLHGREPATGAPSHAVEHFGAAIDAIRAEVPDVIINMSTGGSASVEERVAPVLALRPELATCAMGSFTYGRWNAGGTQLEVDRVAGAPFASMSAILDALTDAGSAADMECYELGHLDNLDVLERLGVTMPKGDVSFVLGVLGSMAADQRNLRALVDRLGSGRHWTAIVIDPERHWAVLRAAIDLGGWVRVGFEDCHWLETQTAATSNGQLVEQAVQMVSSAGRDVAGPAETRALLL